MSKTTHTPGPWAIDQYGARGQWWQILTTDGAQVAGLGDTDFPADEEENARLIAAAPDLLSALRPFLMMDAQDTEITGGQWNAAIVMARAAVAKAKGTE